MGLVFFDQPCRYVQVDSPAASLEILFIVCQGLPPISA
jgi:hypothetical protein